MTNRRIFKFNETLLESLSFTKFLPLSLPTLSPHPTEFIIIWIGNEFFMLAITCTYTLINDDIFSLSQYDQWSIFLANYSSIIFQHLCIYKCKWFLLYSHHIISYFTFKSPAAPYCMLHNPFNVLFYKKLFHFITASDQTML